MRLLDFGEKAIMRYMLVALIVLAAVSPWLPAEAAQAGRFEGDAVVDWRSIPGDVTFEVPLNLTRLAPDITKVAIWCVISSEALVGTPRKQLQTQLELPVAAGQLVSTARVVVPVSSKAFIDPNGIVPKDPTGQPATYKCSLSGFSVLPVGKGGGWNLFGPDIKKPGFHLTPTPSPSEGSFVW